MECCCGTFTVNGQPPGGGIASPAGAPGYELVRLVDIAGDPTQDLGDGVVNIDGVNFTSANSAAAATWRVLNGSGLQFQNVLGGGGNTQWITSGGGQNATNLRVRWRDLVPNYDPTRRYVLQAIVASQNAAASAERVALGVIRPAGVPTGATIAISCAFVGRNTVAAMAGLFSGTSAGTGSTDYAAFDVITWSSNPGTPSAASAFAGQSVAGDYPPMSDLRACGWTQQTGDPAAITAANFVDPFAEVCLAFPTLNNLGAFAAVVSSLRVLMAN